MFLRRNPTIDAKRRLTSALHPKRHERLIAKTLKRRSLLSYEAGRLETASHPNPAPAHRWRMAASPAPATQVPLDV